MILFLLFFQDFQSLRKHHGLGETRKVTIKKGEDEGLGLSITVSVCLQILSNILYMYIGVEKNIL